MHYVNNTELSSHEETRRQFNGGYSGTAKDSQDTLEFSALTNKQFDSTQSEGARITSREAFQNPTLAS